MLRPLHRNASQRVTSARNSALGVCVCVVELGTPSSVDLVCSEPAHMVTSFSNGRMGIFNMETRQLVLELESQTAGEPGKASTYNLSKP